MGTEAPRGQEGRLTKCGDAETKRFGWPLVTHREAAFGGPGGAQILPLEQRGTSAPRWVPLSLIQNRVLGLPQSIGARQEIQARLYWGPCCSRREREQVTGSLSRSIKGGASWFLIWGEGSSVCPGVTAEGWLRCFAPPSVVLSAGGTRSTLLLLPTPFLLPALQKWQLGWVWFCLFVSCCP